MGGRAVTVTFAFVLVAGCATDSPGPTGTGACTTSAECLNGYACIDGRCRVVADVGPGGGPDVFVPGADTGGPTTPPPPFDGGSGFDAALPDGGVAPPIDGGTTTDGMPILPDAFDPDAPIRCGAVDQPCCGMVCNAGLSCLSSVCRPRDECGGLGEPCCATGCDVGLTCQDGACLMCRTSMTTPGVTGTYFDRCGFGGGCASMLTVTGSGTTITFMDGAGPGGETMGIFTLTGGVTASGSFTSGCGAIGTMCDLASVMGTPAGIVFTDRAGTTGTIALSGATASGTVMFPCMGADACSRFFYATAEGSTMTFADTLGTMGSITLSPALVCEM